MASGRTASRTHAWDGRVQCVCSRHGRSRPPRVLADQEVIEIGGKRIRYIDTARVPHGWDAGVIFEETTSTLLCGDLFARVGDGPPVTEGDIVDPAMAAEDLFKYTSLGPSRAPNVRKLAELNPKMLATMHGATLRGDGSAALRELADCYDARLRAALG